MLRANDEDENDVGVSNAAAAAAASAVADVAADDDDGISWGAQRHYFILDNIYFTQENSLYHRLWMLLLDCTAFVAIYAKERQRISEPKVFLLLMKMATIPMLVITDNDDDNDKMWT